MVSGLAVVGGIVLFALWVDFGVSLFQKQEEARRRQERERFDELAKPLYDSINRLTIEFTGIKRLLEMHNGQ